MARQHSLALGALAFQLLARRPDYTEFCVGLVSRALIVTFWASPSNGLHQPRRFSVPSVELNALLRLSYGRFNLTDARVLLLDGPGAGEHEHRASVLAQDG